MKNGVGSTHAQAPQVTVGILNRNGLARLRRCLPSVLALDYPNLEVLVAAFGSPDGSVAYLEQAPSVRILSLGDAFHGARGRQAIVDAAPSAYVFMVDNDIEIPDPALLSRLESRLRERKDVAFLSPLVLDANTDQMNEIGLSLTRVQRRQPIERVRAHGLVRAAGYYGNCVLFRRGIVAELGDFDQHYAFHNNDYDLGSRAHLHGYEVLIATREVVIHHGAQARVDADSVAWRYQYYPSSMLRIVFRNYLARNVALWAPVTAGWIFVKALRLSFLGRSVKPLAAYFRSLPAFARATGADAVPVTGAGMVMGTAHYIAPEQASGAA